MPKKQKLNAYALFMQEYIAAEKRKGRTVTMAQAQTECDPIWKTLSDAEKTEYKTRAKSSNSNRPAVQYTSEGLSVQAILDEELRRENEQRKLNADVYSLISDLQRGGSLEEQPFYIIYVNKYCTTEREVVPAEISLVQFNLECGELSNFHYIIDPVALPEAFTYDAMSHSKECHQIPVPPYSDVDFRFATFTEKGEVFEKLKAWLDARRDENGSLPILFARESKINLIKGALKYLAYSAHSEPLNIRIAGADNLLFLLKNKCVEDGPEPDSGFTIMNAAFEELERDTYQYRSEFTCEFHAKNPDCEDKFYHCSLSIVRRIMYTVCDHCCAHVFIELVPGRHVPMDANTRRGTPYSASRIASGYASHYDSYQGSDHEDDDDDGFSVVSKRSQGSSNSYRPRGQGGFRRYK